MNKTTDVNAVIERHFPSSAHLLTEFMCEEQSQIFRFPHCLVFRGEASANTYTLLPSALRLECHERIHQLACYSGLIFNEITAICLEADYIMAENAIMSYFYRTANEQGLKLPPIPSQWHQHLLNRENFLTKNREWIPHELAGLLALMQHYKLPTRMLDWSKNILVALYFAASGAAKHLENDSGKTDDNMVIWILRTNDFTPGILPPHNALNIKLVTPTYADNPNLYAQKGVMSYIPITRSEYYKAIDRRPLDEQIRSSYSNEKLYYPILVKATIPVQNASHTLKMLDSLGINASTIYPGYGSVYQKMMEDQFTNRDWHSIISRG